MLIRRAAHRSSRSVVLNNSYGVGRAPCRYASGLAQGWESPISIPTASDASASNGCRPSQAATRDQPPKTQGSTHDTELLIDVLGATGASLPLPPRADSVSTQETGQLRNAMKQEAHVSSKSVEKGLSRGRYSRTWQQRMEEVVRQAVLNPVNATTSSDHSGEQEATPSMDMPRLAKQDLYSSYRVLIVDALGMPVDLPEEAPRSLENLVEMAPAILQTQMRNLIEKKRYQFLTPVQVAAIPLMLEYRDVLCIAPTATGKTLCYVYATLLRLLMKDMSDRSSTSTVAKNEDDVNLSRRQIEKHLQEKIDKGEVCPYCELSTTDLRVCPMTGFPHPSASELETDLALRSKQRRALRLEELQSSVAEPRVLVLVPNSQLAFQVYGVYRSLHCDYKIHYMVRASNAEEQQKYLRALESGVDVLVASPETILPALYKHKLSLKKIQTVVMDEVDDIVSVNHFEPMKIILGALPKGALRPQRLLLGASLPPVAYEMIKTKMLLPSHRFVLVDRKAPAERQRESPGSGAPLGSSTKTPGTTSPADAPTNSAALRNGILTSSPNLSHLVFMLGRVEKVQKLERLYQAGTLNPDQRTLIFCNSRHNVAYVRDRLAERVSTVNFTTLSSHASPTAREGVLKMFRTGISTCLISTDLLSRGIDFQGVVYVVHYDMPLDMETWIHRSGRCGRGGALHGKGYVYTFFQPENVRLAKPLVAYLRQHQQLIPPKLREYANQSFIDLFSNSLFHHPTRPYRKDDPQLSTSVLGKGTRRFPDYKQGTIHKHFRPQ